MSETTKYHLACHCQIHVLELTLPNQGLFADNGVCDCSHCLKRRIVWGQSPKGSFKVIRGVGKDGAKELKGYEFGSKNIAHQFCGDCGTHLLGSAYKENANGYMYNLRAIRDAHFDLWKLPLITYKGLDRTPAYNHPTLQDLPGAEEYLAKQNGNRKGNSTANGDAKIYVGSCHCQAVKFAVKSQPLETARLQDCACSICLGNGVIWLYPYQRNVFFHPPASPSNPFLPSKELLTQYTFGNSTNGHYICKTCGCQVYEARVPEDPDSGSFGLNIALLTNIGEYLNDAHGMDSTGKQYIGKSAEKLSGLDKNDVAKSDLPLYELKL